MIRKLLKWLFKSELDELEELQCKIAYQINQSKEATKTLQSYKKQLDTIFKSFDISVDVHQYSRSWAVISLQGSKTDFIKFIDLGDAELRDIKNFLQQYEKNWDNVKIDASPINTQFLKIKP